VQGHAVISGVKFCLSRRKSRIPNFVVNVFEAIYELRHVLGVGVLVLPSGRYRGYFAGIFWKL
jgi:hypothetical protein